MKNDFVCALIVSLLSVPFVPAMDVAQAVSPEINQRPIADAGRDNTVQVGSRVVLNGSASSDPDGDSLSYQWMQTGGNPVELKFAKSPTPSFVAPQVNSSGGLLEFSLVVTENRANHKQSSQADKVTVTVVSPTAPPNCALAAPSRPVLSPADQKMYRVTIRNVIDDTDPYNISVLDITDVTQDEPVHGKDHSNTAPDAVIHVADPFDSVSLRAERSDSGDGRVYIIGFKASDGFESCEGSVSVAVPHQKGSRAIDSGLKIDATRP